MATKQRTNEYRNPDKLKNHELNTKIYHGDMPSAEFVESVKQHGILAPLLVTTADVVISGHRRMKAARVAKLKQVPVIVLRDISDDLDLRELLIVSNKQREKDNEVLAREANELSEIEGARAEIREKAGKTVPADPSTIARQGSKGRTDEKVGEALGVGSGTAAKLAETGKALEEAEAAGDTKKADEIKKGLEQSVAAGHRAATGGGEPAAPKPVKDGLKGPLPKRLWKTFEARKEFKGIVQAIGKMQGRINELQKASAGGFLPIEEITKRLTDAQNAVKFAMPHTECPKCRRKPEDSCKSCCGSGWVTEGTYKRCRTAEDETWIKNRT